MNPQVEIIQINIAGKDQPGLTASLTDILARYDAFILDIGQANIHQSLTLGLLIKTTSDKSGAIMKELLFKASELGINIRFTPISEEHYTAWVGMQGKNRYIITLLGRKLTARHIADVAGVVSRQGLNIDAIKRLTGRVPLRENERAPKSCIEFSVRGSLSEEATTDIQEQFMALSNNGPDISFQRDDIYRRCRRLICFDMDSTLIETEVIDELAERAGVGDKVRAITERAMRGEIDFRESFTERVALLKGLDVSVMEEIAQAELLRLLCQFENINIAQSIAVGDGANDLPMLSLAGLGIAFHAKPKVKATAGQSISTIGLDGILYFLGLKDSWIER